MATVCEVNEGFDSVNTLRYSGLTHLQGAFQFPSDVSLGSAVGWGSARVLPSFRSAPATLLAVLAIWKIRSPSAEALVYAVDLNHMKERHLDGRILLAPGGGTSVFEPLFRPNLLIIDAERASVSSRQKDNDVALLGTQYFGPIRNKRSNTLTSDCVTTTPSSFHATPVLDFLSSFSTNTETIRG